MEEKEKMMLSGRCKEDFEKWYPTRDNNRFNNTGMSMVKYFYGDSERTTEFSRQYGVYVDFFDSVGIRVQLIMDQEAFDFRVLVARKSLGYFDTRHEARIKAIEKANELYNKQDER